MTPFAVAAPIPRADELEPHRQADGSSQQDVHCCAGPGRGPYRPSDLTVCVHRAKVQPTSGALARAGRARHLADLRTRRSAVELQRLLEQRLAARSRSAA